MTSSPMTVTVSAGRFEQWDGLLERNYKFCGAPLDKLQDIADEIEGMSGYPFIELAIEINGKIFYFDLTGVEHG